MGGFSSALGSLAVAITGDTTDLQRKLDEIVTAAEKTGQELSRLDIAAGMADKISAQIDASKTKFAGLADVGKNLMGTGAALTAAITVPLTGIAAAGIAAAEGLNTAKVGFTTMLGSAEAAGKMLEQLRQFASTTPFEFPDLVNAAQRMKALGFETEQIIPTLRTIGDTVAASGKMSKESIDSIVSAFGKMQNSGKVTTEAVNMLTDQGVKAWQILADAAGMSIGDLQKAVEKGAVPAIQAIPALLAGMNEKAGGAMEAMSKTLTGQWSNFKDQITSALVPIGQALIPALQSLVPILTSVMDAVAKGAEWFNKLPDPVKNVALALTGLLVVLGPILLGIGSVITSIAALGPALLGVEATFGATMGVLGPWALAIAGVTVALTLLGTWIYQNWDAIKATLTAAWEGIEEAWSAVWNAITAAVTAIWNGYTTLVQTLWGPLITLFTTMWDAVAPYFTQAWEAIKSSLTGIWNGIKETAASVFGAINAAIAKFLEWAAKIPGVSKLMKLDDVWQSAKKSSEELNKAAESTKKVGDAAAAAAPKITLLATEDKKAAKEAAKHAKEVQNAYIEMQKRYEKQLEDALKTVKWFEDAYAKLNQLNKQLEQSSVDLALTYGKSLESMRTEIKKTVDIIVPETKRIPEEVQKAVKANKDLEEAYKTLGVTSAAALNQQYEDAKKAYDKITASGKASALDIQEAWIAMEKAREAAAIAAGEKIPAEQKKTLEKMEEQVAISTGKQKTKWEELSTDMGTIVGNGIRDMALGLFEGDLSFGEKAKNMLKSLGAAVADSFVKPATDAIAGFVSGAIKSLLSGEGLGGVLDSVLNIGKGLTSIFSGGASVASDIGGGAASAAGGLGGGAQAATGAIGAGLSGTVGMITGAVSAVSGVISNFQFAAMNKSLDLIENYTRHLKIAVWEQEDSIQKRVNSIYELTANAEKNYWGVTTVYYLEFAQKLDTIIGKLDLAPLFTKLQTATDTIKDDVRYVRDAVWEARDYLGNSSERLIEIAGAVGAINTREQNRAMNPPAATWTVNFTGDPIAKMVGDQIMQQLRMQGVNLVPGVSR